MERVIQVPTSAMTNRKYYNTRNRPLYAGNVANRSWTARVRGRCRGSGLDTDYSRTGRDRGLTEDMNADTAGYCASVPRPSADTKNLPG